MSWLDNPVDEPEKYGFKRYAGGGNFENEPYQFYIWAVLKGEDGFYLSTDSGCSCPSPWESHTADSFTGPLTEAQVREEVMSLWNAQSEYVSREPKRQIEADLDAAFGV